MLSVLYLCNTLVEEIKGQINMGLRDPARNFINSLLMENVADAEIFS